MTLLTVSFLTDVCILKASTQTGYHDTEEFFVKTDVFVYLYFFIFDEVYGIYREG